MADSTRVEAGPGIGAGTSAGGTGATHKTATSESKAPGNVKGSDQKAHTANSRLIDDDTLDIEGNEKELEDDELFEELENDDYGMASFREQRIEELKEEVEKRKLIMELDHGVYKDITDEKEVMDTTTKTKQCVIHFYHADFRRCMIVDKHLETLAKKHIKTKFVKIKVENAPFLVEKLQVKILPCVIAFVDGVAVDRLTGFEELGNTDNFSTGMLELRYKTVGVIDDDSKKDKRRQDKKSIFTRDHGSDEGTDDEW
ncbi:hypothetical protein BGZ70_003685 [Mortierella alpina]|uniref:Thioredoxin-like protein n=1 Tax=Mortierella alpina TaxID=64518 RepID=A0A9P6M564_MORAP|nr:hypothetical protein BGZ70_003685 [Mortierella alpina]